MSNGRLAAAADVVVECGQPLRPLHHGALAAHRQTQLAQRIQQAAVAGRRFPSGRFADAVGIERQRALRGDRRIELTDAAGGAVARIHQRGAAAFALLLVVAFEIRTGNKHLAAHFQHRRRAGRIEPQRNAADGAHVLRHVLAGFAVAARGGQRQHALLVPEIDGEAVELELAGIFDGRVAVLELEFAAHARVEIQRPRGLDVGFRVDRQHGHAVRYRREAFQRLAAHAPRGRIGRHQLRVRGFQRFKFAVEAVVLGIRDFRIVEHVVAVIVVVDLLTQQACALGDALGHQENSLSARRLPAATPCASILA